MGDSVGNPQGDVYLTRHAAMTSPSASRASRWRGGSAVKGSHSQTRTPDAASARALAWVTLFPVLLIVLNVAYQLLTVHLAPDVEAGTMHFYSGLFSMLLVSLALPWGWQWPPSWEIWALLLLLSLFSTVGHYMMILAYGLAGPATLSPFLYFQLAFATLGGWLVFSHAPNAWAWLGMALIAVCGIASTRLPGPRSRLPVETEPQV